ncbi:MAG: DMT family transporter [Synergistaceae bacterium]|nr:DMT family transporter [Synergistota bacterium]NLM71263.1 DMT family transporter [Synergistaceae bacterium]
MKSSPSMKSALADLSLVTVSLFWGLSFVAMKDALDSFPTFWLLVLRFTAAALLMAVIFRRKVSSMTMKDVRAGIIVGFFLFLGYATQTLGLNYTTPGKQAFLTSTYVVIVPFLYWALRRVSPGPLSFAASLICLVGMALLSLQEDAGIGVGDTLTFACAFFFALHIIVIEHFVVDTDPLVLTTLQIVMVAVLSLPAALLFETWPGFGDGSGLWSIAYTVVLCTVVAFAVQNTAQKYTPSTHVSILLSLEAVFGALAGVYFMNEVFTSQMIAGCVLIFVAVLLTVSGPSLLKLVSPKRT